MRVSFSDFAPWETPSYVASCGLRKQCMSMGYGLASFKKDLNGSGRQNWRAFRHVMHVQENRDTKQAGVAGIRLRASGICGFINPSLNI